MASDSSLGEALCLFNIFCESHMDTPHQPISSGISSLIITPVTLSSTTSTQDDHAPITSPPELRLRNALPKPQQDTCQQAEQSASQAIQQASQQASQSIQQASQQASQSIQQASQQASQSAAQAVRSATQAVQQAQQSASQSIADAQRSVSSVISSASSAISSMQSSAAQAISSANGQMQSAQISASAAQSDASKAVLQAGAAVAAATGSAAAAGSSFLAAAAKATQSAQASVSAFGAAAASQISQASQQVTASQTQAVTATQAALAIVGSIIASTLITIIIYFLIMRHKKKAKQRSRGQQSSGPAYSSDPKFPVSDQVGTTIAASQSNFTPAAGPTSADSKVSLSMFPSTPTGQSSTSKPSIPVIKTSTVAWNPANPPKAPRLASWLQLQDGVSPFGPINLPTDTNASAPLGGQLKSPHRTIDKSPSPRFRSKLPLRSPTIPVMVPKPEVAVVTKPEVSVVNIPPKRNPTVRKTASPPAKAESPPPPDPSYRESKASVWTDDVPDDGPSPALQSPPQAPKGPVSVTEGYTMKLPSPKNPRSTAEWLADRALNRDSANTAAGQRPLYGFGLPRNPRGSRGGSRILSRLGPQRQEESVQADLGYVQGLNRFLDPNRGSTLSRKGSERSQEYTPGVGKAM